MTVDQLDVAIIGAGTAGLSARSEVSKHTDSYRVFEAGPLGTTCARVGCMPSKAFIQCAEDFHRRKTFSQLGITGASGIAVEWASVMRKTRALRDGFVDYVNQGIEDWSDRHLVCAKARFDETGTLVAAEDRFRPRRTVIATGTRPIVPPEWKALGSRIVTTDKFFELQTLPKRMAVIGLGPIGLELGQALARLGVRVTGFDTSRDIGGLSDKTLRDVALDCISDDFPIVFGEAHVEAAGEDAVSVSWDGDSIEVDQVLVAVGRRPNLDDLGLENLGVTMKDNGIPAFDRETLRIQDSDLYIAGDVSGERAVLHEASDSGRIAGYNAVRKEDHGFRRRVPMLITFCDPQIAQVGEGYQALRDRDAEFVSGEVSFKEQGRAVLARALGGCLRVYLNKKDGAFLGAELFAPRAENIAHMLAQSLQQRATIRDLLLTPFYHPVFEEGLQTALADAAKKTDLRIDAAELMRCGDVPVQCQSAPVGAGRS